MTSEIVTELKTLSAKIDALQSDISELYKVFIDHLPVCQGQNLKVSELQDSNGVRKESSESFVDNFHKSSWNSTKPHNKATIDACIGLEHETTTAPNHKLATGTCTVPEQYELPTCTEPERKEPVSNICTIPDRNEPITKICTILEQNEPIASICTIPERNEPTANICTMSKLKEPKSDICTVHGGNESTKCLCTVHKKIEPTTPSFTVNGQNDQTTGSFTVNGQTTGSFTENGQNEPTTSSFKVNGQTTGSFTENGQNELTTGSFTVNGQNEPTTGSFTVNGQNESTTGSFTVNGQNEPTTGSFTENGQNEPTTGSFTVNGQTTGSFTENGQNEPTTGSFTVNGQYEPITGSFTVNRQNEPTNPKRNELMTGSFTAPKRNESKTGFCSVPEDGEERNCDVTDISTVPKRISTKENVLHGEIKCASSLNFKECREHCLRKALQQSIVLLVENLPYTENDIIDKLIENECLTGTECSDFRNNGSRKDRVRNLVRTIKGRPYKVIKTFVDCVKTLHPEVAASIWELYEKLVKDKTSYRRQCAFCLLKRSVDLKNLADHIWSVGAISDDLYDQIVDARNNKETLWTQLATEFNIAPSPVRQKFLRILAEALIRTGQYRELVMKLSKVSELKCVCVKMEEEPLTPLFSDYDQLDRASINDFDENTSVSPRTTESSSRNSTDLSEILSDDEENENENYFSSQMTADHNRVLYNSSFGLRKGSIHTLGYVGGEMRMQRSNSSGKFHMGNFSVFNKRRASMFM